MPNKQLEDDDNTQEAVDQLTFIMIDIIQTSSTPPTHKELFILMRSHRDFDEKHFWRFNENKLYQLLQKYYIIHKLSSIEEIHTKVVQKSKAESL